MTTESNCPAHNEPYRTEPHPHDRTRQHRYCPECRKEAVENVKETADMSDADIRREAALEQLRAAMKPMRIKPTQRYVLEGGILVPRHMKGGGENGA